MSLVQYITIEAVDADQRLDRWLGRRYEGLTHGRIQKLIRTKQIKINSAKTAADYRLQEHDVVRLPPMVALKASGKAPKNENLSKADASLIKDIVLYEDDWVYVLNKPYGLATQGGTKTTKHIDRLLPGLTQPGDDRPKLVHRLDKETTGVLIIAKNRKAADYLMKQFQGKTVNKTYWAIVLGGPKEADGTIDGPLEKLPGPDGDRMQISRNGQPAFTDFRVLDKLFKTYCWVELKPQTGRTHQLRAHAQAAGWPILGDDKYGGEIEAQEGIENALHLHARQIEFKSKGDKRVKVVAPLPPHMAQTFETLGLELSDGREEAE